jgi:hypothetical protein
MRKLDLEHCTATYNTNNIVFSFTSQKQLGKQVDCSSEDEVDDCVEIMLQLFTLLTLPVHFVSMYLLCLITITWSSDKEDKHWHTSWNPTTMVLHVYMAQLVSIILV